MLRSALRTGDWSSSILSYDDARPDAFGWEPRGQEIVEWFTRWINLATEIALDGPIAISGSTRRAPADEIDSIWECMPTLRPRIDEIARLLHAAAPWAEGRHALMQMLHYTRCRGEEFPERDIDNVQRLIEHMEPADLEARVRAELLRDGT